MCVCERERVCVCVYESMHKHMCVFLCENELIHASPNGVCALVARHKYNAQSIKASEAVH